MLNYKVYGSGDPIIILHGLFGMLDNWRTFARMLEDDYQVILVDQRNHGKSFWSDEFDYHLLSEDLHDVIHELQLERPIIMGHSMGGKTAIQFAHDYPNHVAQLIVIDIAPKAYPSQGHESIFHAVFNLRLENISSRIEAEQSLANGIDNLVVRQFILKNLSRKPEGGYKWKANFASLHENYDHMRDANKLYHQISCPTLFVSGSQSGYITAEDVQLLNQLFSNYQLKEIDAGHWVHAERPKELDALLRTFLTS